MRYVPGILPSGALTEAQIAEILYRELQKIAEASESVEDFIPRILHVEPAKRIAGMVVYADGSDWNPGFGEGLYRRDKTNTSWVPLFDSSSITFRPTFFAHKNGTDQTGIVTSTHTKVTFGTEDWDIGSYFDASDSSWTPPIGKYNINITLYCLSTGALDTAYMLVTLRKNGAVYRQFAARRSGATLDQSVQLVALVDANGTDKFEAYVFMDGAGNKSVGGSSALTFFSGEPV